MSQQKPPSSFNSSPSTTKKRRSTSESPIAKRKKQSAKTKSNHDGKHKSSSKLNDGNLKLFQTLSSIEQTDSAAKKSRNVSLKKQYHQSLASNDLTKIHLTLVELRILVQRCFGGLNDINSGGEEKKEKGDGEKLQIELDALLENLLVARRDLLEFQFDSENDGEKAKMKKKKKKKNGNDPDYGKLIQRANDISTDRDDEEDESDDDNEKSDSDSNGDSSASVDNNKSNNKICTLANTLRSEYKTLQSHWKSTLNKHHANLQLSTGAASASGSKFSGGGDGFKAVDVSFWDQVVGSMEHDKFRSVGSSGASPGNGGDNDYTSSSSNVLSSFDDSKLYQQMLKDFIASGTSAASSTATGPGKKSGAGGMALDPAQEAAERLKRAMRKKSGGVGDADVDLTMLLAPTGGASGETATELNLGGGSSSGGNKKKSTVDRRASKGRKIRYVVHPKLVNFTFPVRRAEPMIEEDVWFKSLFGGVGNR